MLLQIDPKDARSPHRSSVMIITPYRKQEARLGQAITELLERGALGQLDIEVCTLDRCQGREAEYVFISLVRNRATPFLDMPKRWNVALTRAMKGLFIVGDVEAYLTEARRARNHPRSQPMPGQSGAPRVLMSLLARIIEAYDYQIADVVRSNVLQGAK